MVINTLYIDDDLSDLSRYKNKFIKDGRTKNIFNIVPFSPPKNIPNWIEKLDSLSPELLLVDYNLSIPDKDNEVIGITGLSLAAELKQQLKEIPIILFTRKSVFKENDFFKNTLANIDEIIYKNELFQPNSFLIEKLYKIALGYKILREKKSTTLKDILEIVKAPEYDENDCMLTYPPITSKTWTDDAADWVRKILIKYPGILYNPLHTATYLGISEVDFLSEHIQKFFKKAKYNGIFDPPEGRWWKSKIREISKSKMIKKERELMINQGAPLMLERKTGRSINRSKCVFSGESPADWICYILNKPVMIKYSLKYNIDSRHAVFDEARVSFEAIRTSNEVNDERFDPMGKELLPSIRKMQKP